MKQRRLFVLCVVGSTLPTAAAELPRVAGPAMGTTYHVTLARDVPGMSRGEMHREVEDVLARIDRSLSTWRDDSDASRFNRAPADAWVEVAPDLVAIVAIARRVHDATGGAFDIASSSAGESRNIGMDHLQTRTDPPGLRKNHDGLSIDLGGIGPGYAVDCIGERLVALGSSSHLVELGGEVRAWGSPPTGGLWSVAIRGTSDVVELAAGEALATSTARPGRSPIDPRTGRVVDSPAPSATVRATTCAEADARAVAMLVLGASTSGATGRNRNE
ncbi:MAG: FAD:protein FMN transferase [Pirellulales bacterium]